MKLPFRRVVLGILLYGAIFLGCFWAASQIFAERREFRIVFAEPVEANRFSDYKLEIYRGQEWRRHRIARINGQLSENGQSLVFPRVGRTNVWFIKMRQPQKKFAVSALEYGPVRINADAFIISSSERTGSAKLENGVWRLESPRPECIWEITYKGVLPQDSASPWYWAGLIATALVIVGAIFFFRRGLWSCADWLWRGVCRFIRFGRYALAAAMLAAGLTAIYLFLYGHQSTEIEVFFANTSPQGQLRVRTAADAWFSRGFGPQAGYFGKEYICIPEKSPVCKFDATSFQIYYLWLVPKTGETVISKLRIGNDEVNSVDLHNLAIMKPGEENEVTDAGLVVKKPMMFDCHALQHNRHVKHLVFGWILRIALIWCIVLALGLAITAGVPRINWQKLTALNWQKFAAAIALGVAIALLIFAYTTRLCDCTSRIFDGDSECNIGVAINYLCDKPYRMDPFITTGPALIVPIMLILKALNTLSWFAISATVLSLNFLCIILPLALVWILGRYSWERKAFWTFVYVAFLLRGTSLDRLDYFSMLLGEISASGLFLSAAILLHYRRHWSALLVSGLLFGFSCEIKSVMIVLLVAFWGIWVWRFCREIESKESRRENLATLAWNISGFLLAKVGWAIFRIYVLASVAEYQTFLENSHEYSIENGINMNLWSPAFLQKSITDNFDKLTRFNGAGYLVLLAILVVGVIIALLCRRFKREEYLCPALIFSGCVYVVFWLLVQSHGWNVRNLEYGYITLVFGISFGLLNQDKLSSRRNLFYALLAAVGIFGLWSPHKVIRLKPPKAIQLYSKLNPVLEKARDDGAYIFIGLPQHYFYEPKRGRVTSIPVFSNIEKLYSFIQPEYNSIVYCTKRNVEVPARYKGYFNTVLYQDDDFIIRKQEIPGRGKR